MQTGPGAGRLGLSGMSSDDETHAQDAAGPLLGWSLGTGLKARPLDELVEFPCVFSFKAVGEASASFLPDLQGRVERVLGRPVRPEELTVRHSAKGRYESVTLALWVTSGQQVYAIYEAISEDQRVRYIL